MTRADHDFTESNQRGCRPVNLPPEAVALPENTWVTVLRQWVAGGGTATDNSIPLVKVLTIKEIPKPNNPYD
ncbi:MAG: hypothetical protein EXQ60_04195 [Candidatus Nanopelagicales bacterium]|nr:hypothetical protein [Candidatus Nanopelagicales bacterium]